MTTTTMNDNDDAEATEEAETMAVGATEVVSWRPRRRWRSQREVH